MLRAVLLVLTLASTLSGQAVGGVLDLSTWDTNKSVALDGEWLFDGRPVAVPSALKFGDSPFGSGTYRLEVTLPAGAPALALRLPIIGTAYELAVDGVVIERLGVVGGPDTEVPYYRPRVVVLPTGQKKWCSSSRSPTGSTSSRVFTTRCAWAGCRPWWRSARRPRWARRCCSAASS